MTIIEGEDNLGGKDRKLIFLSDKIFCKIFQFDTLSERRHEFPNTLNVAVSSVSSTPVC